MIFGLGGRSFQNLDDGEKCKSFRTLLFADNFYVRKSDFFARAHNLLRLDCIIELHMNQTERLLHFSRQGPAVGIVAY